MPTQRCCCAAVVRLRIVSVGSFEFRFNFEMDLDVLLPSEFITKLGRKKGIQKFLSRSGNRIFKSWMDGRLLCMLRSAFLRYSELTDSALLEIGMSTYYRLKLLHSGFSLSLPWKETIIVIFGSISVSDSGDM